MESLYSNNKFKTSAPTRNDKFELPDRSYSVSDIHNYFEYIFKKHNEKIDNPAIRIYLNKIKNIISFKIKTGYYLEPLGPETKTLHGRTENKITKDKNGENVPHFEITEGILAHCNIANNDYQQDSRVLYTFVSNKPFGSLLEISPKNHIFLKPFNSELQAIEVWFTDQYSQPLEIENRINLTVVIK